MAKNTNYNLARLLYSAMFLALAILLPFLTAQIKSFGAALCPMHLPVILCGFMCGPFWGMAVGASAPLLRSAIYGMPEMVPSALAMAFELAVYAFIVGTLYKKLNKNIIMHYVALITAMVAGRIVWGAVMFIFIAAGVADGEIGFAIIWAKTVLSSIPGIMLQLIVVPFAVNILKSNRLMLN